MVVKIHMQHLKDITDNVQYENFRCHTLASLSMDGKPTKISDWSNKNRLAQLEENKQEHDKKKKKMEMKMEEMFETKIQEEVETKGF